VGGGHGGQGREGKGSQVIGVMRAYLFLIDMHRYTISSYWIDFHMVGWAISPLAFGEEPETFPSRADGRLEVEFISFQDKTAPFHQMRGFQTCSFNRK